MTNLHSIMILIYKPILQNQHFENKNGYTNGKVISTPVYFAIAQNLIPPSTPNTYTNTSTEQKSQEENQQKPTK